MNRKSLLYIGHKYHLKTKSTAFLIELLAQEYDMSFATYDMDAHAFEMNDDVRNGVYDVLLLFQMPVPVSEMEKCFSYHQGVYVPMYDGTGAAPDSFWLQYKDFNILNFSKTLHGKLAAKGFSSRFVQYYPHPQATAHWGDPKSAFFWYRVPWVSFDTLRPLLEQLDIHKLHVHLAPDPGHNLEKAPQDMEKQFQIEYSRWFATKEEMQKEIEKSSYYFAPRTYEGIGMSFLEAMSMGRCTIAVDHPTMNEYIRNGETGYLYSLDQLRLSNLTDVQTIQKQTLQSVREGYAQWMAQSTEIAAWIATKPLTNQRLLRQTTRLADFTQVKRVKGGFLLWGKKADGHYYLFGRLRMSNRIISLLKKAGS